MRNFDNLWILWDRIRIDRHDWQKFNKCDRLGWRVLVYVGQLQTIKIKRIKNVVDCFKLYFWRIWVEK